MGRLFFALIAPVAFLQFVVLVVMLFAAVAMQQWYAAIMAWLGANVAFIGWYLARAHS